MKAGCFTDQPPILCVIPYSLGDYDITSQLLRWITELGRCRHNGCLLVADCKVPADKQAAALELARGAFKGAEAIATPRSLPDESWPRGANWMFKTAAEFIEQNAGVPWWWNEPDCIPLKAGWLEYIEEEYYRAAKPFMGFVLPAVQINGKTVGPCVNGCAVYPADTATRFKDLDWFGLEAWDILASPMMIKETHAGKTIQHFWGEMGLAPTFAKYHRKGETRNTFTLDQVSKSAVVFHRCKDGSLITILRENRGAGVSFFHSGDLGDIVYSLLFARQFGNINLILGPDPTITLRSQMNEKTFSWIKPLLVRQPWITKVDFSPTIPPVRFNLNKFRETWFSPRRRSSTLFAAYGEHFKAGTLPENQQWLTADPEYNRDRPIIIARSERYRNPQFPWRTVSAHYAGRMQFVGFEHEYKEWVRSFGETASYRPVSDALDLANVIAGADLFIGNQSLPMALALSLNVRVIQEVFPGSPDCVFRRPNATYVHGATVDLPTVQTRGVRFVKNEPNANGEIELGPCDNATGLGDTLTILPLARALPKAVMCLPPRVEHYAFLFDGICPLRVTDDAPVFRFEGGGNVAQRKLDFFGVRADCIPKLETQRLDQEKARGFLIPYPNPIAFVPTCSKQWAHIRQKPPEFWEPIITLLSQRYTVLQFGLTDYPLLRGARRMDFVPLPDLAALYSVILRYVGVDTGDHHLMLSCGGQCVVAEPAPCTAFDPRCWQYSAPLRIRYASLENQESVIAAMKTLKFIP